MKKRNLQRIFAAFMATAMVVGGTACSKEEKKADTTPTPTQSENKDTPAPTKEEDTPAPTKEENKTTPEPTVEPTAEPEPDIDLGGMEIIVRDWWSPEDPGEPKNDYEEAQRNYQQEMMEKYNFTIRSLAISDWGSAPQDFVDYVTNKGDDKNYVFVLRNDPAIVSAMASGLMYDLATLDCLDFSDEKFTANRTHEMYSYGSSIYCCFAGPSEPRDGLFFNPDLLKAAGIDPTSIYDMQANGTWTWEAFEDMLSKVQRDTDGDGVDDVFGLCCNNGVCVTTAVISNGGEYVGKDASGKFTYRLEDPETTEALQWITDIFTKYNNHDPEGAEWNYYMSDFRDGHTAFMMDQEYQVGANGVFWGDNAPNFTPGFVMFPKGPKASTYINLWDNNPHAIPACYDADRAWKIAFAWNLYTNPVPGYEDYNGYVVTAQNSIVDERAQDETIPMMSEPEHGTVTYHAVIPDMQAGPEFIWAIGPNADVAAAQEAIRDTWKAYIDAANK
jgi:hypothetical protein